MTIKVELTKFEEAAAEEGLGPVTAENVEEIKDFMYGTMASVVELVDTETVDERDSSRTHGWPG